MPESEIEDSQCLKKYKEMALLWHTDKVRVSNPERIEVAEVMIRKLNQAKSVLSQLGCEAKLVRPEETATTTAMSPEALVRLQLNNVVAGGQFDARFQLSPPFTDAEVVKLADLLGVFVKLATKQQPSPADRQLIMNVVRRKYVK